MMPPDTDVETHVASPKVTVEGLSERVTIRPVALPSTNSPWVMFARYVAVVEFDQIARYTHECLTMGS
jgi:hypothetical protein